MCIRDRHRRTETPALERFLKIRVSAVASDNDAVALRESLREFRLRLSGRARSACGAMKECACWVRQRCQCARWGAGTNCAPKGVFSRFQLNMENSRFSQLIPHRQKTKSPKSRVGGIMLISHPPSTRIGMRHTSPSLHSVAMVTAGGTPRICLSLIHI